MRREPSRRCTAPGMLGFICIVLLCGILYAGLTPFHVPGNEVAWAAGADALRLGERGTLFSPDPFPPPGSAGVERSLEIWVKPGKLVDSNTLLAFYNPASPRHVSIRQDLSDLVVYIEASAAWTTTRTDKMYVPEAFSDGKRAFWTVTFGQSGTGVYRDGVLVRRSTVRPSGAELTGQIIVSGSPIFDESWSGVLSGLAIYDSTLSEAQIARHYASWAEGSPPAITAGDRCIGLYLFNEHTGNIVHNRIRPGNDLYIPPKYMVLRKTLLDPAWRAFDWNRGFWQDALINIAGFIPVGCFLCAYFSARGFTRPALRAMVLGAVVSLFIEVAQAFLPTRDSSMADLINNTLGSILGALMYRGMVVRAIQRGISRMVSVQE